MESTRSVPFIVYVKQSILLYITRNGWHMPSAAILTFCPDSRNAADFTMRRFSAAITRLRIVGPAAGITLSGLPAAICKQWKVRRGSACRLHCRQNKGPDLFPTLYYMQRFRFRAYRPVRFFRIYSTIVSI